MLEWCTRFSPQPWTLLRGSLHLLRLIGFTCNRSVSRFTLGQIASFLMSHGKEGSRKNEEKVFGKETGIVEAWRCVSLLRLISRARAFEALSVRGRGTAAPQKKNGWQVRSNSNICTTYSPRRSPTAVICFVRETKPSDTMLLFPGVLSWEVAKSDFRVSFELFRQKICLTSCDCGGDIRARKTKTWLQWLHRSNPGTRVSGSSKFFV